MHLFIIKGVILCLNIARQTVSNFSHLHRNDSIFLIVNLSAMLEKFWQISLHVTDDATVTRKVSSNRGKWSKMLSLGAKQWRHKSHVYFREGSTYITVSG